MYMLITYDVEAKRTEKFKKLLRKYLIHEQYSVFSGDITEAKAIELRRELSRLMIPGDRVRSCFKNTTRPPIASF